MFPKAFSFGGLLAIAVATVLLTVQPAQAQATPPNGYYHGGYHMTDYRPYSGGYRNLSPTFGNYSNPSPAFGGGAGYISRSGRPTPNYGGYSGYYYGGYGNFYYPNFAFPYYRR